MFAEATSSNQPSSWPLIYGLETSQTIAVGAVATETQKQAESLTWKFTCAADAEEQNVRVAMKPPPNSVLSSFSARLTHLQVYEASSSVFWQDPLKMDVKQGQQNYAVFYPREAGAVVFAIEVPEGCDVVDYSDGQFDQLLTESIAGPTENITFISGGKGQDDMKRYEFHSNSVAADACEYYGLSLATAAQVVGHENCGWGYVSDDVENTFLWMPEDNTDSTNCAGRAGSQTTHWNGQGGAYCYGPNLHPVADAQGFVANEAGAGLAVIQVAKNGDTIYKCYDGFCQKSISGSRNRMNAVADVSEMLPATEFTGTVATTDGQFTLADDGQVLSFATADGLQEFEFPAQCACA